MKVDQYIKAIVQGLEVYFGFFTLADSICHHGGNIKWITPKPGFKGPAIVYKVFLPDAAEKEIKGLVPDLRNGKVPSLWVISPLSTPGNLADILISKGFRDLRNSERPEYGMAMDFTVPFDLPMPDPQVAIRRVTSVSDFKIWIDIVNIALHGWDLLTAEHYTIWFERKEFAFYLGYIGEIPVSTVAIIQDGKNASLEFVSTLKEYRNRGAACAVCLKAMRDLQVNGVEIVTLRSSFEAHKLYEKLGFRPYYEQRLLSFQKAEQEEAAF